ncbi:hypothetical protein ACFQX9_11870 [Bradyrhizobium sp. GCM10028915]|uniref:hypothetical protein n=1 Tax=Bradyrhizobium sp. GCM10028915 TaxID=3273385 RepID=UPI0036208F06
MRLAGVGSNALLRHSLSESFRDFQTSAMILPKVTMSAARPYRAAGPFVAQPKIQDLIGDDQNSMLASRPLNRAQELWCGRDITSPARHHIDEDSPSLDAFASINCSAKLG